MNNAHNIKLVFRKQDGPWQFEVLDRNLPILPLLLYTRKLEGLWSENGKIYGQKTGKFMVRPHRFHSLKYQIGE